MDRLIKNPKLRKIAAKINTFKLFLDKNMSLMLLIAVVLFGLAILDFQKDGQTILDNQAQEQLDRLNTVETVTDDSNENTEEILERVERSESLLCALFLQHDIDIQLPDDLRSKCQEELESRGVQMGGQLPPVQRLEQPVQDTEPSSNKVNRDNPPQIPGSPEPNSLIFEQCTLPIVVNNICV